MFWSGGTVMLIHLHLASYEMVVILRSKIYMPFL